LNDVLKVVTEDFEKLSPQNREERITEFYRENRELFLAKDDSDPQQENASRALPFDAVADLAKSLLLKHQARQRVQMLLEEAKHLSQRQNLDLRDLPMEERAAQASDYQAIAQQLSAEMPGVEYVKTEFLTRDALWESGLGRASLDSRSAYSLMEMLFSCAPIQKNSDATLDNVPFELYEDIGPAFAPADDDSGSYYLLRIVAVDKARPPLSLADDGRRGPPEKQVSDINNSKLTERVREDWKMLQAFQLAEGQARLFARQAEDDWDAALAQARASLDDKLKETAELTAPFPEQNLQSVRTQVEQLRQFLHHRPSNSPNLGPYISTQITQANALLQKAADLCLQKSQMNQENLALLVRPENFHCLVFRTLTIPTITDQEYAQYKNFVEITLLNQNQALASLTHFNPVGIEKRTGFTFTEDAD
jgi:hypothetical protein